MTFVPPIPVMSPVFMNEQYEELDNDIDSIIEKIDSMILSLYKEISYIHTKCIKGKLYYYHKTPNTKLKYIGKENPILLYKKRIKQLEEIKELKIEYDKVVENAKSIDAKLVLKIIKLQDEIKANTTQ